jgi:predicted outer membrane repeat protein
MLRTLFAFTLTCACLGHGVATPAVSAAQVAELARARAPEALAVGRFYSGTAPCDTTLQACISASADGDSVLIRPGIYVTASLNITRAVTLSGAGTSPAAVVLRPTSGRMIQVNAPNIASTPTEISNLTIENGDTLPNSSGGAVRVQSGSGVPLFNRLVISNSVASGGGAIRILSTLPATISGSLFISNTSSGSGGAISTNGALTLINTRIEANHAVTSGGGIEVDGALVISNSQLRGNTAISGGAIYAGAAVTITDGSLSRNLANAGGALYAPGPQTVLISGAVVFDSNDADFGQGGAIWSEGAV